MKQTSINKSLERKKRGNIFSQSKIDDDITTKENQHDEEKENSDESVVSLM